METTFTPAALCPQPAAAPPVGREEDGNKHKRVESGGEAEAAEKREEELEQTKSIKLEEEDGPDMVCVDRCACQ